jgi:hypothetical protein
MASMPEQSKSASVKSKEELIMDKAIELYHAENAAKAALDASGVYYPTRSLTGGKQYPTYVGLSLRIDRTPTDEECEVDIMLYKLRYGILKIVNGKVVE